jgi:hypothetical protein
LLAAEAAWSDPYQRHAITTWTSDSATMAVVQMPAHETQAREGWIGTWPWDLYVATDRYGWSRLAEGSLTFVLGDARSLSPMMPEVARA